MKLPAYPLITLQRHRERCRDQVRERLAERLQQLAEMEGALSQQQRDLEKLQARRQRAEEETFEAARGAGQFSAGVVRRLGEAIECLREQLEQGHEALEQSRQRVEEMQSQVEQVRVELNHANQEVEVVKQHYDRWRSKAMGEVRRKEEQLASEVATSAWVRQSAGRAS